MPNESTTTKAAAPSGISRRRVVAGAAWAVPAVAVATAAPASAQSVPPVNISDFGVGCKYPGQSDKSRPYGYVFYVEFTNDSTEDVTITIDSISLDGQPLTVDEIQLEDGTVVTQPFSLAAGDSIQLAIFATGATNSQNGQLVIGYSWYVGATKIDSATASTGLNSLPPLQNKSLCTGFASLDN
jgi:hypothetical protein